MYPRKRSSSGHHGRSEMGQDCHAPGRSLRTGSTHRSGETARSLTSADLAIWEMAPRPAPAIVHDDGRMSDGIAIGRFVGIGAGFASPFRPGEPSSLRVAFAVLDEYASAKPPPLRSVSL